MAAETRNYLFVRIMFALLGAVLLWRSAATAYAYFDMRTAEVRVKKSRLIIDHNPSPGEPAYEFAIEIELETTDSSHRGINELLHLPDVSVPEEAYDELAKWAPGTVHKIHLIRGDATDVRLEPDREPSPELNDALITLIPGVFAVLGWVAFQGAAGKFGARAFSIVFFIFGLPMLLAGFSILGECAWKRFVWQQVEVKVIAANQQFDPARVPAGTRVHPVAAQKLAEYGVYRLAEFPLNKRTLHMGLSTSGTASSYDLWVNPRNRFDYSWDPWLRATGPDVFVFLLMGSVFSSIGVFIFRVGPALSTEEEEEEAQPQAS